MKLNMDQTKYVGLTMELDLKTREYKMLCDKLEKVKEMNVDPNDERLLWLKNMFEKNNKEISDIVSQLKSLEDESK